MTTSPTNAIAASASDRAGDADTGGAIPRPLWDEGERLAALARYAVLDTPREAEFDDVVRLASDVFDAPISVVNLIAGGRQWFKAEVGIGADELPLDVSICAHAILQPGVFVVPDTTKDARFACNPLVTGEPGLRFYAGALLETPEGLPLGTVCVLDTKPRPEGITDRQRLTLEVLARQVMTQLELRRAVAARDADIARTRASEQRLGLVLDAARDYAIITTDPERRITSFSAGAEAAFGMDAADAVGRSADELFTPEDRAQGRPEYETSTANSEGCSNDERWHQRADGGRVFLNGSVHPLPRDESGRERGFIKIARDETDRRAADATLAESEERFRNLADHAPVMMWVTDPTGACLYLNRAWYAFTGQTREEAEGFGWLHATHPEHKAEAERIFLEANATPQPFRLEYRLRRADGAYRWAIDTASPRLGPDGEFLGFVGSVIDIDERREVEDALRQTSRRLDAILNNTREAVFLMNERQHCVYANAAAEALTGYGFGEMQGRPLHDVVHHKRPDGSHYPLDECPIDRAFPARAQMSGEELFVAPDGSFYPVAFTASPVLDDGGRPIGTVIEARDITREKAAEAELRELNERLESRVAEEVAERTKAEEQLRQAQKMEAVGQLTGGIAHDFNNLLTGVIGSLDMMQRRMAKGETERIERYTSAALASANRAAALTHRLLAFSRRQPLDPKPVNANRLVTGMEELLRRTIGESVQLEIVAAGGLWRTLCDPHQLESAILNLAINARDAMPGGGTLTIETCNAHLDNAYAARSREVKPGQYICICVTDTGTGMTGDVVEKAFDPFFTTKPIGQGTGLGLSMIYGFTRQSEGYAKIYSEVGQGTTVKLYLPRHYGEAEEGEKERGRLTDEHRAAHGETVLVVEDEAAVRALVVDVLEELGYRAIEAADGPSGLRILQSDARVDLLVTDVGLPGLNGRQLADAARRTRPDLKVLFITGYAENAAISSGFLEPGMQMITKPFAIETLATRIRDMIEDQPSR